MSTPTKEETLDTLLTREQRADLTFLIREATKKMRDVIIQTFDAPSSPPSAVAQIPASAAVHEADEKTKCLPQVHEEPPHESAETNSTNVTLDVSREEPKKEPLPSSPPKFKTEALKKNCLHSFDVWRQSVIERIGEVIDTQKEKDGEPNAGVYSSDKKPGEKEYQGDILQELYPPVETCLLELPQAHRNTILQSLLFLFLSLGSYDSRSRALLLLLASSLHVPLSVLLEQESHTASSIIKAAENSKEMNADEESKKRSDESRFSRGWKIGLASIAGAALIGITGGLAAPLVAAGIGTVMSGIGLGATAVASYLGAIAGSGALVGAMFGAYGAKMTGEMMERYSAEVEDFAFIPIKPKHEKEEKRLRVTIGISGWLTSPQGVVTPWKVLNSAHVDIYALRWETQALQSLGTSLESYIKSYAWGYVKSEIIKRTVLATLYSALWPIGLLKFARVIDNPYSVARHRSDKAGLVLADALMNHCQGLRPVTLIGFSLGSRVIYSCLKSLAERGGFGIVSDVYLLGSPIPVASSDWKVMKSVVAGRLVNGYSGVDWVLGFLERGTSLKVGVAGIQKVKLHGVENIDLAEKKLVEGHLRYSEVMGIILKEMGIAALGDLEMGELGWEEEVLKKVRMMELKTEQEAKDRMEKGKNPEEDIEQAVDKTEKDLEKQRESGELEMKRNQEA